MQMALCLFKVIEDIKWVHEGKRTGGMILAKFLSWKAFSRLAGCIVPQNEEVMLVAAEKKSLSKWYGAHYEQRSNASPDRHHVCFR